MYNVYCPETNLIAQNSSSQIPEAKNTYTDTHIDTHTHTLTHTHKHTRSHIPVCIHGHTYTATHMHTKMDKHIQTEITYFPIYILTDGSEKKNELEIL